MFKIFPLNINSEKQTPISHLCESESIMSCSEIIKY